LTTGVGITHCSRTRTVCLR